MAPEVLQHRPYDFRADVWSLGITAIEMADGLPPLHGVGPSQAMRTIPRSPPPTLAQPRRHSRDFVAFVAACLVKDPADRPEPADLLAHPFIQSAKSAAVLADAIRDCLRIRERRRREAPAPPAPPTGSSDEEEPQEEAGFAAVLRSRFMRASGPPPGGAGGAFDTVVRRDGEDGEDGEDDEADPYSTVVMRADSDSSGTASDDDRIHPLLRGLSLPPADILALQAYVDLRLSELAAADP